jgi:hypothetical protein
MIQPLPLTTNDIVHLNRKCHLACARAKRVFDLEQSGIDIIRVDKSGIGRGQSPYHAHDIVSLSRGKRYFVAKSEDVFLKLTDEQRRQYQSFGDFVQSLFDVDDGFTPVRVFRFEDDPEISSARFTRQDILAASAPIDHITDATPPSAIDNANIRQLFCIYIDRKSRLIVTDHDVYENTFNHHGRDVVTEFLASSLGYLLGCRIPRSFLGLGKAGYNSGLQNAKFNNPPHTRYSVSVAIQGPRTPRSLLDYFVDYFRSHGDRESASWLRTGWHYGNPLGIHFFETEKPAHPVRNATMDQIATVILHDFRYPDTLMSSDALDRLFGAQKDRKLDEYLIPFGNSGWIFTVDYGESFFPELAFAADDRHYIKTKAELLADLGRYVERILRLPPACYYRRMSGRVIGLFLLIPRSFFSTLIQAIPKRFFSYSYGSERLTINLMTLEDMLVAEHDELKRLLGIGAVCSVDGIMQCINGRFLYDSPVSHLE